MRSHAFNPIKDIPSLAGKVILITGGNAGLGKQNALDLSKHSPAQLWIAARNIQSGNDAVAEIKTVASPQTAVKLLEMDLTSFASIKNAARKFSAEVGRLDILLLNAGIMGGVARVTKEGYENVFGTNHMGHALLLKLLTPLLLKAAEQPIGIEPRVVILSSRGHKSYPLPPSGIELATIKSPQSNLSGVSKYCQSKLANAVYAAPVAKRYPQFTTVAIYPGDANTGLFSKGSHGGGWMITLLAWVVAPLVAMPVKEVAKNSEWAATAEGVESGAYYDPVGKKEGESQLVRDGKLGEQLWEWTQKELKGHEI
ncbi:NAD(P)-binding protein [Trematosphaeria pertusa]|uniref:NAD(P)-binding protein n=1 Tax=Trematosphaeria pertusa TaxID=390896 RepID=A0A6A6IIX4_9PLEO|nr:NAD(P)-binding protein [Trematosphaeria pertusa]KAF2250326.1 NAD(P)-binding protein [Trematosphaeria pertusa]